jgi:hypothetical protein
MSNIKINKITIDNPRYTYFNVLKEIKTLVDLTLKSADIIKNQLKDFEGQRTKQKDETIKSLFSIINDLNDKNYSKINVVIQANKDEVYFAKYVTNNNLEEVASPIRTPPKKAGIKEFTLLFLPKRKFKNLRFFYF